MHVRNFVRSVEGSIPGKGLGIQKVKRLVECALACTDQDGCRYYVYNQAMKLCQVIAPPDGCDTYEVEPGWKIYINSLYM